MNLSAWLERITQLHPRAWDLGLERVATVARQLDVLKPAPHIFLVAGTNGKGSTCEVLESLCLSAGMSVGKSTSPHLIHFNERVVVNGVAASDEAICAAFESIERARGEISLSYFEFSTLAALLIFKARKVDVAVLEIGLGGRLDAMNIVDPDVSIITHIALDHEAWLGDNTDTIAIEKAGIMRVGKPCVIADETPPSTLFDCAKSSGTNLVTINRDYGVEGVEARFWTREGQVRMSVPEDARLPIPSLLGAIQAFAIEFELPPESVVDKLFRDLGLAGRYQRFETGHTVILDVAHNPDAALRLANRLAKEPGQQCRAVFGMYKDKDIAGVVAAMAPHIATWYVCASVEDRAAAPAYLRAVIESFGGSVGGTYDKVCAAYTDACSESEMGDIVLVFGSFPIVGQVLEQLTTSIDNLSVSHS